MKERLGSWLILASKDLVAADAAAHIMNYKITDIKQLVMAHKRGMGALDTTSFDVVGEKLENLQLDWKSAKLASFPLPESQEEA